MSNLKRCYLIINCMYMLNVARKVYMKEILHCKTQFQLICIRANSPENERNLFQTEKWCMFALNGLKVSVLSIYHSILPHMTELSSGELNELRTFSLKM